MTKRMSSRRMRNAYYYVYDIHTDELVIGGTVKEVCDRLDITKSNVVQAVKNHRLVRRKYRIYYEDED